MRQLQTIDSAIDDLGRRRAELKREATAEEVNVCGAREQLEVRRSSSQDLRREIDRKELELKQAEEKMATLDGQLGRVKTNREFTTLQREIAGVKADASLLEDESLEMMERMDVARQRITEAEEKLAEAEKSCAAHREAVHVRQGEIDKDVDQLQQERLAPQAEISVSQRQVYEHLRAMSDGMAVVAARNGVCQGCFMNLTSNTVNLLMGGDEFIRCHSCGRVLFLDNEED